MLFRINAQSEAFEEALAARGIPYVVRGAARFFDRAEVRAGGHPAARRRPRRQGDGDDLVDDVRAVLSGMGWTPEAAGRPRPDPRPWESLQALVDQAERVRAGTDGADLGGFVDDLDRRAAEQHAPVADGVTLATLHAAKGLEWDAVFVCGVQEGTLPITYADYARRDRGGAPAALRRHDPRPRAPRVSWAWPATRAAARTRKPSRFLDRAAARAASSASAAPARQDPRKVGPLPRVRQAAGHRRREEGGPLRRLPGVLRRGAVRAAARVAARPGRRGEVPAYVVFTDATLQLIAEHKPGSPAGAAAHQRHRPGQARPVRRRPSSPSWADPEDDREIQRNTR